MTKYLVILLVLVLGSYFVFSGSSEASLKEGFLEAIAASRDQYRVCINLPEGLASELKHPVAVTENIDLNGIKVHEILVSAGLEAELPKREIKSSWGSPTIERVFDITEEGKKVFYKINSIIMTRMAFCFGEPEVLSIDSFTEPASRFMGPKASQVKFTYRVNGLPAWLLQNEEKLKGETLEKISDQPQQETAMLVLTNNGWVDSDTLSRIPFKMTLVHQ